MEVRCCQGATGWPGAGQWCWGAGGIAQVQPGRFTDTGGLVTGREESARTWIWGINKRFSSLAHLLIEEGLF